MKKNGKLAILLACVLLTGCGKGAKDNSNASVVSNSTQVGTATSGNTNTGSSDTDATVSDITTPGAAAENMSFTKYDMNTIRTVRADFDKANLSRYSAFVDIVNTALAGNIDAIEATTDDAFNGSELLTVYKGRDNDVEITYVFYYEGVDYTIKVNVEADGRLTFYAEKYDCTTYADCAFYFDTPAACEYYTFGKYVTAEWEQKYKGTDVTEDWKLQANRADFKLLSEIDSKVKDGTFQAALRTFLDANGKDMTTQRSSLETDMGVLSEKVLVYDVHLDSYLTSLKLNNISILYSPERDEITLTLTVTNFDRIVEIRKVSSESTYYLIPWTRNYITSEVAETVEMPFNTVDECITAATKLDFSESYVQKYAFDCVQGRLCYQSMRFGAKERIVEENGVLYAINLGNNYAYAIDYNSTDTEVVIADVVDGVKVIGVAFDGMTRLNHQAYHPEDISSDYKSTLSSIKRLVVPSGVYVYDLTELGINPEYTLVYNNPVVCIALSNGVENCNLELSDSTSVIDDEIFNVHFKSVSYGGTTYTPTSGTDWLAIPSMAGMIQ